MCPRCQKKVITRFGPYGTSFIFNWLFSCQSIDSGCKWWTETNNPFQYSFIRSIGLETQCQKSPQRSKTTEEIHSEWRHAAGLDHLPFNKAIEAEEEKILEEAAKS